MAKGKFSNLSWFLRSKVQSQYSVLIGEVPKTLSVQTFTYIHQLIFINPKKKTFISSFQLAFNVVQCPNLFLSKTKLLYLSLFITHFLTLFTLYTCLLLCFWCPFVTMFIWQNFFSTAKCIWLHFYSHVASIISL